MVFAPPVVYGKGEGIKKSSFITSILVGAIKQRGRSFNIGQGGSFIGGVHVKDVADMLICFVEEALAPEGGRVEWGERGFYFADNRDYVIGDVVKAFTKEMYGRGLIGSEEIDSIGVEEANALDPLAGIMLGTNLRTRGSRMKALGWEAKREDMFEAIHEMLD